MAFFENCVRAARTRTARAHTARNAGARGSPAGSPRGIRKRIFVVQLCVVCAAARAQNVSFFSREMRWSFESGARLEFAGDLSPDAVSGDFSAALDMRELYAKSGFRFRPESLDFTTEIAYGPTFWGRLNVGADMIFHVLAYYDEFTELDFLPGLCVSYTDSRVTARAKGMYFRKAASIRAIRGSVPWLTNDGAATEHYIEVRPFDRWAFYFRFASYTFYRFMDWFCPDFMLGARARITETLTAGAEIDAQYIDMFVLSANLDSVSARLFVRLEF